VRKFTHAVGVVLTNTELLKLYLVTTLIVKHWPADGIAPTPKR
jgi:hypothetical protein